MKIKLSKDAIKFLDKANKSEGERIREKIIALYYSINNYGLIPFKELDIKRLAGEWKGFLRMRIGKVRVIFKIDTLNKELLIYQIDFRGKIYK
jgi:mRNA interferase RelE/StbE